MTEADTGAPRSRKPAVSKARSSVKPKTDTVVNHVLLERLLAMAQRYRSEGNFREAMGLYWELAEDHPGTPEADAASATLLDLAANYERNAAPHMARSIYKRLLAEAD